jgi:hypothetical protein
MSGAAGAQIGTAGVQPPIGAYVQDATAPAGNTNFIGVNTGVSWSYNQLGIDIGFTAPVDDNPATGGLATWVKSASVLVPGDKVTIAAGVATKDNSTGTHNVFCNAAVNDYLWVPTAATT